MKRLLRQIILLSIVVCRHAWSANVPLVPWELTRTGNGSVNISTNSDLSQISFNVQNNASGTGGTYGYATSTTSLGTINSNTIYVLSSSANLWGPGTGGMALLANGVGVAVVGVPTTSPGSFANYTASFTTGDLAIRTSVKACRSSSMPAAITSAMGPSPRLTISPLILILCNPPSR
jgi:hypothetical protein